MRKTTIRLFIVLSKTSEYALRAVLHLARCGADRTVRASEMASALAVPANYLSKILHNLARAGILSSERGQVVEDLGEVVGGYGERARHLAGADRAIGAFSGQVEHGPQSIFGSLGEHGE